MTIGIGKIRVLDVMGWAWGERSDVLEMPGRKKCFVWRRIQISKHVFWAKVAAVVVVIVATAATAFCLAFVKYSA